MSWFPSEDAGSLRVPARAERPPCQRVSQDGAIIMSTSTKGLAMKLFKISAVVAVDAEDESDKGVCARDHIDTTSFDCHILSWEEIPQVLTGVDDA